MKMPEMIVLLNNLKRTKPVESKKELVLMDNKTVVKFGDKK